MYSEEYLYHHGIKGMKWGIRRYRNEDGSLTAEGQKRYGVKTEAEWRTRRSEMTSERRKLREKADEKFNVQGKSAKLDGQEMVAKQMKDLFNVDMEDLTTYRRKEYETAVANAHDYVEKRMSKKFGASYEQLVREEATFDAIVLGSALLIGAGLVVANKRKTRG